MASCARCRRSAPAGGDTWCLACSAWEALGNELSFAWSHPGLRAVATDLVVSAVRQVRALRVTRGDSSTPRAAPPAAVPPVPGPRVAERTGSVPAGGNSGPERERSPLPRSSGRGRDTGGGPPAPAVEESSEAEDEEEESEAESEKTLLLAPNTRGESNQGLASKSAPSVPPEQVAGVKTEVTEERADRAAGGSAEPIARRHRRRHHHEGDREKKSSKRDGEGRKSRKKRNPKHRAGRKHKRLYRAEQDPYVKLHRTLDDSHYRFDPNASRESAIAGTPPRPKQ